MKAKIKKFIDDITKKYPWIRKLCRHISYATKRTLYFVVQITNPVKEKQILFSAFGGKLYCDSPRAIYEYMNKSDKYSDYTFIWVFKEPSEKEEFFKDKRNTIIVQRKKMAYFKALASSKYWVMNAMLPITSRKKKNQVFVQTWHGTPLKKIRYSITAQGAVTHDNEELHWINDKDAPRYTYFLSSSPFCTEEYMRAFNFEALGKSDIFLETGYPRNDYLFNFTPEEIKSRKEALGVDCNKKVILYAPTFRDNQHKSGQGYIYSIGLDLDKLSAQLKDEYVLLFRTHYLISNSIDLEKYKGFIVNVSDYEDIKDLYPMADALITDYSSVFFDYANLKRPIIYYMYDLDLYRDELRGFCFDLSELPGPIVKTQAELTDEIKALGTYSERYSEKYAAFNKKFNPWDDKDSSRRVAEAVFK